MFGLAWTAFGQAGAVLTVQADKPTVAISPTLYGLMTEEINHAYDGGLYGELISNRTFQIAQFNTMHQWTLVENAGDGVAMKEDHTTGPSAALPWSLRVDVTNATASDPAGIENSGYWGIAVRPNTTYRGSVWAKADAVSAGPITIALVKDDTGATAAKTAVDATATDWKQYEYTLQTGAVTAAADYHFVMTVAHPGTLWLQLASLFPPTYNNQPNGFRSDLMEKLAAMHPAFLRFPGGNYLEGNRVADRFDWKKTIGPLVDRPGHQGPWSYHSSDGMGLLEFLEWCEDLHMQPVLAVYAGYSLSQDHVNPGTDLDPYVQDALDEIQYVTGGADTKWGAERAKNGHPAPFKLTYVEIGNEDQFDRSRSYDARFAQFYKAIKAAYPDLQLIATTKVTSVTPDVVDDHYYRSSQEFFADTHHYDNAPRNGPKIFVGEWATLEGIPTPDFGAALGDAAWMTGMERNSDLIVMASYAPLFVNVNPMAMQWGTNLIGYDADRSYGSPSYYAQVLFSEYKGDHVVESSLENAGPLLFYSATKDTAGHKLYLKIVNAAPTAQAVEIKLPGASVAATAAMITLHAKTTKDTNSIERPDQIVPHTPSLSRVGADFRHTFEAYSINVMEIRLK